MVEEVVVGTNLEALPGSYYSREDTRPSCYCRLRRHVLEEVVVVVGEVVFGGRCCWERLMLI